MKEASSPDTWRYLYAAAMLEMNSSKLPDRIREAEAAILTRLGQPHDGETQALEDPLQDLRVLRRERA